jgi:hypothetical protein
MWQTVKPNSSHRLKKDCVGPNYKWIPKSGSRKGRCQELISTTTVPTTTVPTALTSNFVPLSIKESLKKFSSFQNNIDSIISYNRTCPSVDIDRAIETIDKDQDAPELVTNRLDDEKNQTLIECTIKSIFDKVAHKSKHNDTFKVLTAQLKEYFSIQKLTTDSAYGSTFFVYPKSNSQKTFSVDNLKKAGRSPISIMKLVQNYGDAQSLSTEYSEILHEVAIGFCLNSLRSFVPTFAYTYNGFICDILQKTEAVSCKNTSEKFSTVISFQEYVDGKPFAGSTVKDTIHIFLQVAHALYLAEKEFKYVHFDLHGGNVLIKKLTTPITIELKSDKYNIKLSKVSFVPYIIDYGMSALVKPDGTFLGNLKIREPGYEYITVLGCCESSYYVPSYDIYRFVTHTFNFKKPDFIALSKACFAVFKTPISNIMSSSKLTVREREMYGYYQYFLDTPNLPNFQYDTFEEFMNDHSNMLRFSTINWGHADAAELFRAVDCGDWIVAFVKEYKGTF